MLNPPQRPIAPPPTWSQYLKRHRASRGTVVPPTRWGYLLVVVAALLVMSTSVVTIPDGSSLLPAVAQTLWGHPGFLVAFLLTLAATIAALIAGTSRRPRSVRVGLHAGLLLSMAGLTYIVAFIDTARRAALLNDNEIGIGNGAIIGGVLGVVALAIAVPDIVQLPDLNRVPILRYAVGYAWAPALAGATMLLVDVRIGSSYAARVSGLTDGGTEGENAAVNAGRLGLAGSGLTYTLVIVALVLLAIAALATWVRRPRRLAHIPAALIAGPLVAVAALLLMITMLRMLISTPRTAGQIGADLGVSGADVHLNIAYGGWVVLVAAAGLLVVGALATQAGLSTPRIPPQLAGRGLRPAGAPYSAGRVDPGSTMHLPYHAGLGPAPMPVYVEIPPEFAHGSDSGATVDPELADAPAADGSAGPSMGAGGTAGPSMGADGTAGPATGAGGSATSAGGAATQNAGIDGPSAQAPDDEDASSATAQYAAHPVPSTERPS